jgi:hypothetical protein
MRGRFCMETDLLAASRLNGRLSLDIRFSFA